MSLDGHSMHLPILFCEHAGPGVQPAQAMIKVLYFDVSALSDAQPQGDLSARGASGVYQAVVAPWGCVFGLANLATPGVHRCISMARVSFWTRPRNASLLSGLGVGRTSSTSLRSRSTFVKLAAA